jgi:hypothetical protein
MGHEGQARCGAGGWTAAQGGGGVGVKPHCVFGGGHAVGGGLEQSVQTGQVVQVRRNHLGDCLSAFCMILGMLCQFAVGWWPGLFWLLQQLLQFSQS